MAYPWLVRGDFNVILNVEKKIGGLLVYPNEVEDFSFFANSCELADLTLKTVISHGGMVGLMKSSSLKDWIDCLLSFLSRRNVLCGLEILARSREDIVRVKEQLFEESYIVAINIILSKAHVKYNMYLHFEKGRRKRLEIFIIQKVDGSWTEGNEVVDEAIEFYQDQFNIRKWAEISPRFLGLKFVNLRWEEDDINQLMQEGRWNGELLRHNFHEKVVEHILNKIDIVYECEERLIKQRIPIGEFFVRVGLDKVVRYSCCDLSVNETLEHLFISCNAKLLWEMFARVAGRNRVKHGGKISNFSMTAEINRNVHSLVMSSPGIECTNVTQIKPQNVIQDIVLGVPLLGIDKEARSRGPSTGTDVKSFNLFQEAVVYAPSELNLSKDKELGLWSSRFDKTNE
ncbi:hypothetical protein H5410_030932 [Solanum commersonii]|uniref:Uncharacterized protein n=1 Tax=Solanum commersonii TaxID=4109 RepID=A0A9J5YGZ9_SOLCO|nr:hypothetical protein H5410_030932 [Solanum commersonii]